MSTLLCVRPLQCVTIYTNCIWCIVAQNMNFACHKSDHEYNPVGVCLALMCRKRVPF